MSKGFFIFFSVATLVLVGCRTVPTDSNWPPLRTEELSFSTRENKNSPKFTTEIIDIKRGSQRTAQLNKIHRPNNEFSGEYAFSAFVAGRRVFISNRIGGTNEGSHFLSLGDVQVMKDVRFGARTCQLWLL